jgi:hypothetical protein
MLDFNLQIYFSSLFPSRSTYSLIGSRLALKWPCWVHFARFSAKHFTAFLMAKLAGGRVLTKAKHSEEAENRALKTVQRTIFLLAAGVLFWCATAAAQLPTPRIFFSDIDSGPSNGGEVVNGFSGVYVTLYGNFFGSSQGSSRVTWNGIDCLRVAPPTGSYSGWGASYS